MRLFLGLTNDRRNRLKLFAVAKIHQFYYTPTGVQSIFASALSEPRGVAFGHGGNLFVANTTFDPGSQTFQVTIVKITPPVDGLLSIDGYINGNDCTTKQVATYILERIARLKQDA